MQSEIPDDVMETAKAVVDRMPTHAFKGDCVADVAKAIMAHAALSAVEPSVGILQEAYKAGFLASTIGYNAELYDNFEKDPEWLGARYADISALTAQVQDVAEERYRHKKRGSIYTVTARGRLQVDGDLDNEKVVVYRGEDGQTWVRPEYEFNDGRFEPLTAAPAKQEG